MAGFDFIIDINKKERQRIKPICRYLQKIYSSHSLKYRYRTKMSGSKIELCVQIDGSLANMQYLDRKLPQILKDFYSINGQKKDIQVIVSYLKATRNRLYELTDFIFEVAEKFKARPVLKTLSRSSLEAISKTKTNTKTKIRSRIVQIIDFWNDSTHDTKSCVILLNQAMEEFIKLLIHEPKTSKIGFKEAVEKAFTAGTLNEKEKKKLLIYNKTRNRLQHRQGKTTNTVVDNMATIYMDIVEAHK